MCVTAVDENALGRQTRCLADGRTDACIGIEVDSEEIQSNQRCPRCTVIQHDSATPEGVVDSLRGAAAESVP